MTTRRKFKTVLLDAVDRLGSPVVGVEFVLMTSGADGPSVVKRDRGPVPVQVEKTNQRVNIEARYPGWPTQALTLDVDAVQHTFTFAGAGEPTVLVVCALNIEMEAVLATFDWRSDGVEAGPAGDPVQYWIGQYGAVGEDKGVRRVRLASSGMGNNNAAVLATHALRSFYSRLQHVVMVGIAGGCPNHLKAEDHVRLGDIVVSTKGVVQYDYQKRLEDAVLYRSMPQKASKQLIDAASTLEIKSSNPANPVPWMPWIDRATKDDSRFARPQTDILHVGNAVVDHPPDPARRTDTPRVHGGMIGSANILLKNPKLRDDVRDRFGVRAIEMEGSGIMDAGWAMEKDIMVVRGVCDYCDGYKDDSWQRYAALAAAAYTRSLIEALPESWFP